MLVALTAPQRGGENVPTRVLTAALQMTTDRQQMTEVSAASACVSTVDVLRCMRAVSRCMHAQRKEGFACNAKQCGSALRT